MFKTMVNSIEELSHNIFHKGKYYVTFKRGVEDIKRDITITIEKVFPMDCLKIILSDDDDPSFLCVLVITRCDYDELKKQQGLLVDFENFPTQLIKLLQQCVANNMFLILQQSNPLMIILEFVEHNEFKRLVHLSLKTGPATDSDIKRHMSETIVNLKKHLSNLKLKYSSNEKANNERCATMEHRLSEITLNLAKMEEEKARQEAEYQESIKRERERMSQERLEWQKSVEATTKSQMNSTQEMLLRKDRQIDELNTRCRQLQDSTKTLEFQLSDKNQRLSILEKDVQSFHIEMATLRAKVNLMEKESFEKEKIIQQYKSKLTECEKELHEKVVSLRETQDVLTKLKTEKLALEDKISHGEGLLNKHNQAFQTTSEQLMKANELIANQNAEISVLKEKTLCRTAIALEQEKVIERNTREMEELRGKLEDTCGLLDDVRLQVNKLKAEAETNEKLLKERDEMIKNNNLVIQWLHKKLEGHVAPSEYDAPLSSHRRTTNFTSSTPFQQDRGYTDEPHDMSEDIPNFYAMPCRSEPVTARDTNTQRETDIRSKALAMGLDPQYLEPVFRRNRSKSPKGDNSKGSQSAKLSSVNNKENKSTNLPKANVPEKKTSARSTTSYKRTPISAYFPWNS